MVKSIWPPEGKVFTGVVKNFDDLKGFGFILDPNNAEFFIHWKDIVGPEEGHKSLAKGQHVKALGFEGPKGLYAKQVQVFSV
jgi:CspA family cold shock protein